MHSFFDRSPNEVAAEISGKVLRIGDKIAVIRKALPKTEQDNLPWLDSKPLFGEEPVDVYVSSHRGSFLLFLRTGERNTCVRIEEVALEGRVVSGPGRVGKALGLTVEMTGDLAFDGTVLTITWHGA